MSTSKKFGIAVGMAALALVGLTTGCRSGSSFDRSQWSWGCLTEADAAGAPAYAEIAEVGAGEIVRVWAESERTNVTLEVLGGSFTEIAPGAHEAGEDGMVLADDLSIDLVRCEGASDEDEVCTSIDAASIEVELLEDGARRVAYHGTTIESGETVAIEGSFVVGR